MASLNSARFNRERKMEPLKFTDNVHEPRKHAVDEDFFVCDLCGSSLEITKGGAMLVCLDKDCERFHGN